MLKTTTEEERKHIESLIVNMCCHALENGVKAGNEFISYDEMDAIVEYLKTSAPNKELFEECWVAYKRKGSKKKSLEYWKKLSDKEKNLVLPHIKAYVSTRELVYQKDFERYLRDKTFLCVVFNGNTAIFDPQMFDGGTYTPQGRTIWYNEATKSYWTDDNFYYSTISDGYDDNNRPDGATLTLNNARGDIRWNSNTKKWDKK